MLTKAAIFGHDPNWGRIAAAAGYAGVPFSVEELDITLGEIPLLKAGTPVGFRPSEASRYLEVLVLCYPITVVHVCVLRSNVPNEEQFPFGFVLEQDLEREWLGDAI